MDASSFVSGGEEGFEFGFKMLFEILDQGIFKRSFGLLSCRFDSDMIFLAIREMRNNSLRFPASKENLICFLRVC